MVRFETEDEVTLIDPFLPAGRTSFDSAREAGPRAPDAGRALPRARRTSSSGTAHRSGHRRGPSGGRIPNPATTTELPRGVEAIELDGEPQQVVVLHPRARDARDRRRCFERDGRRAARLRRRSRSRALAAVAGCARRPPDRARHHPARRCDTAHGAAAPRGGQRSCQKEPLRPSVQDADSAQGGARRRADLRLRLPGGLGVEEIRLVRQGLLADPSRVNEHDVTAVGDRVGDPAAVRRPRESRGRARHVDHQLRACSVRLHRPEIAVAVEGDALAVR